MGGDVADGGGGVSAPAGWGAPERVEIVPTCPICGVPVPEDASLCDECRLAALDRMLVLREYLARTVSNETCAMPYKYRRLS